MAQPLRPDVGRFFCDYDVTGTYVLGYSNASDINIPRLDLLQFDPNTRQAHITDVSGCILESDISFSDNLYEHACNGDIIGLNSRYGKYRVLLSSAANSNTVLVTEQCNNLCQFCSQPPKRIDDSFHYLNAALSILNFNSKEYIGITGGEPTIYRSHFLKLLKTLKDFQCPSKLHILTNGRSFSDPSFLADVISALPDTEIIWGIPIYGHTSLLHDGLVRADGAFLETISGISGLLSYGQNIEIRVVPVLGNYEYLEKIIQFLGAHFSFLGSVSIMNMEPIGFAKGNFKSLFVPVHQQNPFLVGAVTLGRSMGVNIQLFNYPLCLLAEGLRLYAPKSISDWKNYYPVACELCSLKSDCSGFFTSAVGNYMEKVEAVHA